ncbi:MAG: sigma-70 family RNA polymerase sigma factor [Chloroflexota bacterium]
MDDERQLISESQRGDLDAFNTLVERHQGQVYNLALRMLGDGDLAADAAQETFISAHRAIKGFRGGNFRSWLLRIATNACLDLMRAAKARRSISLDALELTPESVPLSREESPDSYAIRRELGQAIQRGLEALSHHHRLAVVLIDIQGFTYQEAARIMGCSEGTVKSRLSRARAELREAMQQHAELLPDQFRL